MQYNSERPHESLNNLTPEEYQLMDEKTGNLKKCVELKRVCLQGHYLKTGLWCCVVFWVNLQES